MIGYLKGTVVDIWEGAVLLDVGGVGYLIEMPSSFLSRLPQAGNTVQIYTNLIIRDDQINLYGFLEKKALMAFRVLLEVSGVGPKLALNVLSVLSPEELIADIAKGDTARIRSVHGVGKKTAARICVDLKEKAAKILAKEGMDSSEMESSSPDEGGSVLADDAISALVNLGYKPNEAKRVTAEILSKEGNIGLDQVITRALQLLSKVR